MRHAFKQFAIASILIALPFAASAHRNWLLPSSTQVESGSPWITFDAAVSENLFDFETNAVKLDNLSITGPDGKTVKAENLFTGRLRSSFDLNATQVGTYKIDLIVESLMVSYKDKGQPKRWRGPQENFAKEVPVDATDVQTTKLHNRLETFITSGAPNNAAFKSTNVGLELVPVTHPTELTAGDKAKFRLLVDGKAVAGLPISIVPGGVRYRGALKEITVTTDADGAFSVTWPEAGMYWISASYPPRPAPTAQNVPPTAAPMPERRLSYSGTVEVQLP